jgi:triosephosphate isomerase
MSAAAHTAAAASTGHGGRRPLVVGNWKMHKTVAESVAFARALREAGAASHPAEVVIAPAFLALHATHGVTYDAGIGLAAQDVHWETHGAYTGEVSATQLHHVGCAYCIVGHSERRHLFGERDEDVRRKVTALLAHHITPIVCVGETLLERDRGETIAVVLREVREAFLGLDASSLDRVVVAYEPLWAIGTGRTATPADAQHVHAAIRELLVELAGLERAARIRVLYGGSVKPDNAAALLAEPDVDGALVGGAALDVQSFMAIVAAAR